MAAQPAPRPATYADIEALPPNVVGEIVDGELYVHPRPARKHGRAATGLGAELYGPFDRGRGGPGGWIFLDEPEIHLGSEVLVPDLAGWHSGRLPELSDDEDEDEPFTTIAPEWVCEVLSKSTEKLDRGKKMGIYGQYGVGHLWLVHPRRRTLEAYKNDAGVLCLFGTWQGSDVARIAPFEALALELCVLWA